MTQNEAGNDEISPEAIAIVRKHTYASLAAGVLPIPLVDVGILGTIQFRMVRQLAAHYEVDFPEQRAKTIIGSLVGLTLASTAGGLLKMLIPKGAQLLFGLGTLTVPAATTYGLGQLFIKHFQSGGTIWTFDPERGKQDLEKEVETAKKVVEEDYTGVKP